MSQSPRYSSLQSGFSESDALKLIYLEPAWKLRNTPYIRAFFSNPPSGYRFIADQASSTFLSKTSKLGFAQDAKGAVERVFPLQLFKSLSDSFQRPPHSASLTLALDHLVLRNETWVLEMTFENSYILVGTEKQLKLLRATVSKYLLSNKCKRILIKFERQKQAFDNQISRELDDKMEIVPSYTYPQPWLDRPNSDTVKLLFVNSANFSSDYIFYFKGGPEVIEAFLKLKKEYENVELILRTNIPDNYYLKLSKIKGVRIVKGVLPRPELEQLFRDADIFVHPHYSNLSAVLLEAMSYGLPIVTTDTWATPELVENGRHGLIVHNSLAAKFTEGAVFHMSDPEYMRRIRRGPQKDVVDGIVEKVSYLIDHPALRRRLGKNGWLEVTEGKYSIENRNKKLKRILDESTQN